LAIRSLASDGPKQLIPIASKPNIQYCVEGLWDAGVTDIGIILGNVMPEKRSVIAVRYSRQKSMTPS
jgi:glucose-1-phosphate thymidylyltransferase